MVTRVVLLCAVFYVLCSSVEAQQPAKTAQIGYLSGAEATNDIERSQGIKRALGDLGYREGENIAFEFRYANEKIDRIPELAAELVRLKVDLIVAAGGRAIIEAPMNLTKTIPIILGGQGPDPVESGFVKTLAHPGGNVTGVTTLLVGMGDKRLELLKEAVPAITRVAVPYVPGNETHLLELKEVKNAAHGLSVTVLTYEN